MPPNTFNRIGLGGVRWEEVDFDPRSMSIKILHDFSAAMERSVVADYVNFSIAAKSPPQIVKVLDEQLRVTPSPGFGDDDSASTPVNRPCKVSFHVVAGGGNSGLLPDSRPARTNLGVEVDIDFVLKERRVILG